MKWLLVKEGVVKHAFAAREDAWLRHYKARKFLVLEVEDSAPGTEGWLYQDGQLVDPTPPPPPDPPPETPPE